MRRGCEEESCVGRAQKEGELGSGGLTDWRHESLICRIIIQCVSVGLGEDIIKENPGVASLTQLASPQPSPVVTATLPCHSICTIPRADTLSLERPV